MTPTQINARKHYNNLSEGQQRLCVVSFEEKYNKYPHNLINRAMEHVNPLVRENDMSMMEALPEYDEAIKNAANDIVAKFEEMKKEIGL